MKTSKKAAVQELQKSQEHIYDATHTLEYLRISKESRKAVNSVISELDKADQLISDAIENIS